MQAVSPPNLFACMPQSQALTFRGTVLSWVADGGLSAEPNSLSPGSCDFKRLCTAGGTQSGRRAVWGAHAGLRMCGFASLPASLLACLHAINPGRGTAPCSAGPACNPTLRQAPAQAPRIRRQLPSPLQLQRPPGRKKGKRKKERKRGEE